MSLSLYLRDTRSATQRCAERDDGIYTIQCPCEELGNPLDSIFSGGRETKPRVMMADDHSLTLAGMRKPAEEQCEMAGMVEAGRVLVEAA